MRECLPARHRRNAVNSLRLALFSREELGRVREETGLKNFHRECGVNFRYGIAVEGLERKKERITSIATSTGPVSADAVVLCAGSYSAALLRPRALNLPVYPVKGYSVTLPITDPACALRVSLTDESRKIVVSRLGNRLRAAGPAEITGHDTTMNQKRADAVMRGLLALFPEAGKSASKAEFWTGLRPMTPDGPPVIGATPIPNLYLNTRHGTLGWTMSTGPGKLLAEVISGKAASIDVEGLTFNRY